MANASANLSWRPIWFASLLALSINSLAIPATQSNVTTVTTAATTTAATTTGRPASARAGSELATGEMAPEVALVREDELAGLLDESARDSRTTVKKELAPTEPSIMSLSTQSEPLATTSTTRAPSSGDIGQLNGQEAIQQAISRARDSVPQLVQQAGLADSLPVSVSPEVSRSLDAFAARLPESIESQLSALNSSSSSGDDKQSGSPNIDSLLPKGTSLFNRDSVDATQLGQMDCHLRNIDYCLAGLMGSSQKLLPESNDELEVRCDEMKATTSCMAVYNRRCATLKVFSLMAPFAQASEAEQESQLVGEQRRLVAQLGRETKLTAQMEAQLLNKNVSSLRAQRISVANLMEFCEPGARGSQANRDLRQRLFSLAKCINARVPKLNPCLEDLKAALQVFYEPRRALPLRPTCCALARFRACSSEAIDRVCGLSSFEQLLGSVGTAGGAAQTGSGPVAMLKAIERVCRQAADHKSAYCAEVLPPSGLRAPQRRGHKASKLAKALDLFSFSPAVQESGAL